MFLFRCVSSDGFTLLENTMEIYRLIWSQSPELRVSRRSAAHTDLRSAPRRRHRARPPRRLTHSGFLLRCLGPPYLYQIKHKKSIFFKSFSAGEATCRNRTPVSGLNLAGIHEKKKMSLVDLGKRLLEAARKGQDDEVRNLMANGAPFTTDWLGTSPLHLAAQHGHYSTADVLLRAGVSRDARTKVDRTPLHMAAAEGHTVIVELLVRSGADINAKDMLKMTALHWAAQHGHHGVAETLIKHGADVHALSKFDKTPFDIAVDIQNTELMLLLQEGMQNQVNMNQVNLNQVSMNMEGGTTNQPQFIIQGIPSIQGGVVNLAELLNKANAGDSEEAMAASALDSNIQHATVVNEGGQRVITIVTDQHGNLQTTGGMAPPFFVTMQHGQQMLAVPANAVTEEVVTEEPQPPPARKRKLEVTNNHNDTGETELLQRQLQEANRKAQEYRQQLMRKEQEAEEYRVKLEAMSQSQAASNAAAAAAAASPEEVVGGEEDEEEAAAGMVEEEGEMVVLQEGGIIMEGEEGQVTLVETGGETTEVSS